MVQHEMGGMSAGEALARVGPPEVVLKPAEKSFEQLVLETGFARDWSDKRKRRIDELERERLESLR